MRISFNMGDLSVFNLYLHILYNKNTRIYLKTAYLVHLLAYCALRVGAVSNTRNSLYQRCSMTSAGWGVAVHNSNHY